MYVKVRQYSSDAKTYPCPFYQCLCSQHDIQVELWTKTIKFLNILSGEDSINPEVNGVLLNYTYNFADVFLVSFYCKLCLIIALFRCLF